MVTYERISYLVRSIEAIFYPEMCYNLFMTSEDFLSLFLKKSFISKTFLPLKLVTIFFEEFFHQENSYPRPIFKLGRGVIKDPRD